MTKAEILLQSFTEAEKEEGKTLYFTTQNGNRFVISLESKTLGHVMKYNEHTFPLPNTSWIITGFSKNPQKNSPDFKVTTDLTRDAVKGKYVWDLDHGTTRRWGDKISK
jgi:late competence protein required for DNA uptake (superfamily II DNA/RNA helicase)